MTKVVAIKDMSAGNDTVGEMWQETAIFDIDTPLADVFKWAIKDTKHPSKKRIQITIANDFSLEIS